DLKTPVRVYVDNNLFAPWEQAKGLAAQYPKDHMLILSRGFDHAKGVRDSQGYLEIFKIYKDFGEVIFDILKQDRSSGNKPQPRVPGADTHEDYYLQFSGQLKNGNLKVGSDAFAKSVMEILEETLQLCKEYKLAPFLASILIKKP